MHIAYNIPALINFYLNVYSYFLSSSYSPPNYRMYLFAQRRLDNIIQDVKAKLCIQSKFLEGRNLDLYVFILPLYITAWLIFSKHSQKIKSIIILRNVLYSYLHHLFILFFIPICMYGHTPNSENFKLEKFWMKISVLLNQVWQGIL